MTISISILLYAYYAFLVFWGGLLLVALFHLFAYGFRRASTMFAAAVIVTVAVALCASSLALVASADWSAEYRITPGFFSEPAEI